MAIIYEHWRPDTNECFYVGVTRGPKSRRPLDMTQRNIHHRRVQQKLERLGMEPEVRILWEDIPEDCIGTYEKIRIAYWRALHGERLTNQLSGGYSNYEWSEDLRIQVGEKLTQVYAALPKEVLHERGLRSAETKRRNGTHPYGDRHPSRKMTKEQLQEKAARGLATARERGHTCAGDRNPMKIPEVANKIGEIRVEFWAGLTEAERKAIGQKSAATRIETGTQRAKLKKSQVLEILASDKSNQELAQIYSMNPESVRSIRVGLTWTHVSGIVYQRKR